MDERTACSPQVRGLCRRLAAATSAVLSQCALPECCILAARVLSLACERVGIPFRCYPSTALIANPTGRDWYVARGGRFPDEYEFEDWERAGACLLQIGTGRRDKDWWGWHLVCVLADVWLCDPSLPLSCTRPRRNLSPPSFLCLTSAGILESVGHFLALGRWGMALYTHAPHAPSWTDAPDWTRVAAARRLSREVLRLVQRVDEWGPMDSGA